MIASVTGASPPLPPPPPPPPPPPSSSLSSNHHPESSSSQSLSLHQRPAISQCSSPCPSHQSHISKEPQPEPCRRGCQSRDSTAEVSLNRRG
eukprot:3617241-Rhodomonas_salina.1